MHPRHPAAGIRDRPGPWWRSRPAPAPRAWPASRSSRPAKRSFPRPSRRHSSLVGRRQWRTLVTSLLGMESRIVSRRTVFFVSDQTGVTAETLGHSLLTQFDGLEFRPVTLPFVSSVDKAQ